MNTEKARFYTAMFIPAGILLLAWGVKVFEIISGLNLYFLGLYPLSAKGLPGIVLSPLLHADFKHLIANSVPFVLLGWALFYYYQKVALKILIIAWFTVGVWVWLFARENYHIGASGIVYFLASFHLLSGIIRRNKSLISFSMLVIFLYGGMFWGMFPDFFPHQNVSWESHLMGAIAGVIFAFSFRKDGPEDDSYHFDEEEEEEDDDDESFYEVNSSDSADEGINEDKHGNSPGVSDVKYHYRRQQN